VPPGRHVEQLCAFHFEGPDLDEFDAEIDDPPEAWKAHNPNAQHHENREVELTEPTIRPPTETVRDQRHRKRVNEEIGYISGGVSTGVVVKPRPATSWRKSSTNGSRGGRTTSRRRSRGRPRQALRAEARWRPLRRGHPHIVIAFVRSEEKREIMQMISRLENGGQMSDAMTAMKAAAAGYR